MPEMAVAHEDWNGSVCEMDARPCSWMFTVATTKSITTLLGSGYDIQKKIMCDNADTRHALAVRKSCVYSRVEI